MSTFQLDQCASAQRIVDACRDEGNGDAQLLPRLLHDTPDMRLVPEMMRGNAVFVTQDRRLPLQCAFLIPDDNPGIVLVTNHPNRHQTMTVNRMLRLLAQVKANVPQWYEVPLSNSILEVTAEGVAVGHVERGVFKNDGYFEFADTEWPGNFLAALVANASRFPRTLPPS